MPARAGADGRLVLPWGETIAPRRRFPPDAGASGEAVVMVRPERVALQPPSGGTQGRVLRVEFLGAIVRYAVAVEGLAEPLVADGARPLPGIGEGSNLRIGFAGDDAVAYARGGGP